MKKTKPHFDSDMLSEYDFTGKKGVRGKYHEAYQKGHSVRIHKEDGTIETSYFTLEDGAVMLEPDVREFFSTSKDVNKVLRSLIALIPKTQAHQASAKQ